MTNNLVPVNKIVPANFSFYHLTTNLNGRRWEKNNYIYKKHIFLHNNLKKFGNHQIKAYKNYQGGTFYNAGKKNRIIEFKTTRPLKLLNLYNKGPLNAFNIINKIHPIPHIQYIKNLFQAYTYGRVRSSIYDRVKFPALRYYIQDYIHDTLLAHGYDGIYEGNPFYNSILLFNVGNKLKFEKYIKNS